MVVWRRSHRQWKRAAQDAVAEARVAGERDRLSTAVARRIWLANGGRTWADRRSEGALLLLESLVSRALTDEIVRASLALEYLALIEDTARRADYEEAGEVWAEIEWSKRFLEPSLEGLGNLLGDFRSGQGKVTEKRAQLVRLQEAVTASVVEELRQSGLIGLAGLAA